MTFDNGTSRSDDDQVPTTDELAKVGHLLDGMALATAVEKLKAVQGSDARLSAARYEAMELINRRSETCAANLSGSKTCDKRDEICPAFDMFQKAEKLETSAKDILAAAILMPKSDFAEKLRLWKTDLHTVAAHFDVPIGAVALRRRILHDAPSE